MHEKKSQNKFIVYIYHNRCSILIQFRVGIFVRYLFNSNGNQTTYTLLFAAVPGVRFCSDVIRASTEKMNRSLKCHYDVTKFDSPS